MLDEELKMLNDYKKLLGDKYKVKHFETNYTPTFDVNSKSVKPQIDAMFETQDGKTYLVEAYSTYAWRSGKWKDYQDRKVRNDAFKLLAIIQLFKEHEQKDNVFGIILLHSTTHNSFITSDRNTVTYLKTLGIMVEPVYSNTAVAALARRSSKELQTMLEEAQKLSSEILKILDDLGGEQEDTEESQDLLNEAQTLKKEMLAQLLADLKGQDN